MVFLSLTFFCRPFVVQQLPSNLNYAFCLVVDEGGRSSLQNTQPHKGTSASFFNFSVTSLPFRDASHRSLAETHLRTRSNDQGDPSAGKPTLDGPSIAPTAPVCVTRPTRGRLGSAREARPDLAARPGCAPPAAPRYRGAQGDPGARSPGMMDAEMKGRGAGPSRRRGAAGGWHLPEGTAAGRRGGGRRRRR